MALFLLPFLWMIFLSFKDNFGIFSAPFSLPKTWDFSLYVQTWKNATIGRLFVNSLKIAVSSAAVSMFLIYMSSYAIARLVMKGRRFNNFVYYFFLAGMAIPVFAQLMTIYKLTFRIGSVIPIFAIGQVWSMFFPYIALQIAFLTLVLVGGLRSVPTALEEAALIDGCNLFQMMFQIVLPTIKPVFMTALILNFLGIWNEYPVASILLTAQRNFTIPLATVLFKVNLTNDYGATLRSAVLIMLPQILFYLIFQRYIVEGMATAGIKG